MGTNYTPERPSADAPQRRPEQRYNTQRPVRPQTTAPRYDGSPPPHRQPPRRKASGRFYALLAILVLALIVLAFVAVAALRFSNLY